MSPANLAMKLERLKHSPVLSLVHNAIGDSECNMIAQHMRENILLKTVDFSGNNIRADGLVILSNALRMCQGVTSLTLKYNMVGNFPHGIQALCDALKVNTSVTFLDLRNNSIGPEAGPVIGDMLRHNRTLTHVDLSWNEIGPVGGRSLLLGVEANPVIVELNLNGTRLLDETLHGVDLSLRRNHMNLRVGHTSILHSPRALYSPRAIHNSSTAFPMDSPSARVRDHFPASSGARLVHDDDIAHRMLHKERTCTNSEDASLIADAADQIHRLQLDIEHHKNQRAHLESKEQETAKTFRDRELQYANEARELQQVNSNVHLDKERLLTETRRLQSDLDQKQSEKKRTEQETIRLHESAQIAMDRLRAELQVALQGKADLEGKVMNVKRCKAEQEDENARLRAHITRCKADLGRALGQ